MTHRDAGRANQRYPGPAGRSSDDHAVGVPGRSTQVEALYRRAADAGAADGNGPEVQAALARRGSGQPLPDATRQRLEAAMGVALERVRIHTDSIAAAAAQAVHAEAFTVGEDIFFAAGAFAPDSPGGERLLRHELTHVVQGWQGRTARPGAGVHTSDPGEALEHEAETVASSGQSGAAAAPAAAPPPSHGVALFRNPRPQPAGLAIVEKADHLVASATDDTIVGWRWAGGWLVAIDRGRPSPLGPAAIGTLAGSHAARVVAMRPATSNAGTWTLGARWSAVAVEGDAGSAQLLGELATGAPGRWVLHGMHGATDALPAELTRVISENDRVEIGDQFYLWMTYPAGLNTASTAGWSTAGHTKRETNTRVASMRAVADRMPEPLRTQVLNHIEAISVVSVVEGGFDATSGSISDTSGSLGIFQWARPRDPGEGPDSIDSRFFVVMAQRAHEAQRKTTAGETPTGEEQAAFAAWQQAEALGIGVDGNRTTIRHNGTARNAGGLDLELAGAGSTGLNDSFQVSQAVRHGRNIDGALAGAEADRRERARKNPRAAVSPKDAKIADDTMLDGVIGQLAAAIRDIVGSDLVAGDAPRETALRAQLTALQAPAVATRDPATPDEQQITALDALRRDKIARIRAAEPLIRSAIDRKLRSAPQMATDEMKRYQLVAAVDWINSMQAERVVPKYARYLGHSLPGATITSASAELALDDRTLQLTATAGSTVSQHLQSERAIAAMAMIGVNRPAYVATALWAALMPGLPATEVNARLTRILAAVDALDPAPGQEAHRRRRANPRAAATRITEAALLRMLAAPPAEHQDAAHDATTALAELKALLWPAAGTTPEDEIIARYRAEVMRIYNVIEPQDAGDHNRAGRLVTVEMIDWDAVAAAQAQP